MATIAYKIRNSLYLNVTNRCSNICTFCPKFEGYKLQGNDLLLQREPSFQEVMAAVDAEDEFGEIVFCGFGESLIRLDLVVCVARELKKRYGCRIRINTDGQANLVHGRNIIPELVGLVDTVSVSLNAPDAVTYIRLCNTPFGSAGFSAVCDFIREARHQIPKVIASVVNVPGVDIDACRVLAESLGATFRVREFKDE
ncbi:MAG: TatD family nuclease-associated radical SAM protein [Chlorobium sp.]